MYAVLCEGSVLGHDDLFAWFLKTRQSRVHTLGNQPHPVVGSFALKFESHRFPAACGLNC